MICYEISHRYKNLSPIIWRSAKIYPKNFVIVFSDYRNYLIHIIDITLSQVFLYWKNIPVLLFSYDLKDVLPKNIQICKYY